MKRKYETKTQKSLQVKVKKLLLKNIDGRNITHIVNKINKVIYFEVWAETTGMVCVAETAICLSICTVPFLLY